MIQLLNKLPEKMTVAVSGGGDSLACLDFLSKKRDVAAIFFNHGTEASEKGLELTISFCKERDVALHIGNIGRERKKEESMEEYWRNERYNFFDKVKGPIITCHHLDDVVEWWVFTSLHGNPKLIPYSRGKYLRPFLLNKKSVLTNWCRRNHVNYFNDPSNRSDLYARGYIRNNLIPAINHINPGIHKTLKKKLIKQYKKSNSLDIIPHSG